MSSNKNPSLESTPNHSTNKNPTSAEIYKHELPKMHKLPANPQQQKPRYHKTRNIHTQSSTQDGGSSLEYSSTDSSHTTKIKLRPSSTIHPKSNTQNRKKASGGLSHKWAEIFSTTGATNKTNTSTPIKQWKRSTTPSGKEHDHTSTFDGIQTRIYTPNSFQPDNTPFGDNIEYNADSACFLFHNINGVKDEANWAQINTTMHELQVTGFGFAETNTTCRGRHYDKWHSITRKIFKTSRTSTLEAT
jgi:hypothetical protein